MRTIQKGFGTSLIGLVLAVLAVSGAQGQPVSATTLKVGFVNVQRLLEEAPQSQDMMAELREEFAPRQRDLVAMQTELTAKQEIYQRDASVMGESERVDLERQIQQETRDLQRADNELREDYNIRQNEELSVLQRLLSNVVQAFARQAGYDLVLADVVYFSAGVDITADVLTSMQDGAESEGD